MRSAWMIGVLVVIGSGTARAAAEGPKVSVTRFDQEVFHYYDGCGGWAWREQDQLRTELETGLAERGLRVLERKDIRKIYDDEYGLPNLDQSGVPARGKFLSARYTVTGAVTEMGVCEDSEGTGVQLGGIVSLLGGPAADINLGKGSATSKIKLKASVISTETGEVLKTFEAHSEANEGGYEVGASMLGIGANHHARKRAPMERASNEAIRDLSMQIASYIRERE